MDKTPKTSKLFQSKLIFKIKQLNRLDYESKLHRVQRTKIHSELQIGRNLITDNKNLG